MIEKIFQQFLKSRSVTTDTRAISRGDIYFALKGERFNGNQFAQQALDMGCAMAVLDEDPGFSDDRIIIVDDALKAMQEVAGMYRDTFSFPVLAITGSNGKTTTKELLMAVLSKKYRVHATKGNLNNHIGVPLTLMATPENAEFAIIEMGANHQKEIQSYCRYACPDYGLITNIGKAHLEGFGGLEGVKKGKRELYDDVHQRGGKVFVNVELEKLKEVSEGMDIIPYGFEQDGFQLSIIGETPFLSFELETQEGSFVVNTQLSGAYNLYNFASALAVGKHFEVSISEQIQALENYSPDNNRSQIARTAKNTLIMDAYNANPSSMEHALINLSKQKGDTFFVIGDMRELGEEGPSEHLAILEKVRELGLEGITVGQVFQQVAGFPEIKRFENNTAARAHLLEHPMEGHMILIKGSRGIRLEELKDIF